MSAILISPSGAMLHHRARRSTTPAGQAEAKAVRVWHRKEFRLEENRVFLRHRNVRAFVRAVSETPGGDGQSAPERWRDKGALMGLADFGQETQDLIAVELLRELGVMDKLLAGDVWSVLLEAPRCWPQLPPAPGATGSFKPPATGYERFCAIYKRFGGTVNELAGALGFGRRMEGRDPAAPANDPAS